MDWTVAAAGGSSAIYFLLDTWALIIYYLPSGLLENRMRACNSRSLRSFQKCSIPI